MRSQNKEFDNAFDKMYRDLALSYMTKLLISEIWPLTSSIYENLRNIESHAFRGSLKVIDRIKEKERLNWFKALILRSMYRANEENKNESRIWAEKSDITGRIIDWLLSYYHFEINISSSNGYGTNIDIKWPIKEKD